MNRCFDRDRLNELWVGDITNPDRGGMAVHCPNAGASPQCRRSEPTGQHLQGGPQHRRVKPRGPTCVRHATSPSIGRGVAVTAGGTGEGDEFRSEAELFL